jgi:ABC-2 type transport system permease protein
MRDLLRSEIVKLRSVRTTWVLTTAAIVYPAMGMIGAATARDGQRPSLDVQTVADALKGGGQVAVVAALLLGILASVGEYRHGTIVPALLVTPQRVRLLVSKGLTAAALGAVIGVGTCVVAVGSAAWYLVANGADLATPADGDIAVTVGGVILAASLYGALGVAVGAVVRQQTAAVAGALFWVLLVENVLPIVVRRPELRQWLPGGAVARLFEPTADGLDLLPLWAAAASLVAVVTAASVVGAMVTARADIA